MSDIELPEIEAFEVDHSFQVGFECGAIWAVMLHCDDEVREGATFNTHIQNAEMLLELADTIGYTIQSEELDEHWMIVRFAKNV